MAQLSDTEFHKSVESFENGNSAIDYIVRCFTTGDEEEFQVLELGVGFKHEYREAIVAALPLSDSTTVLWCGVYLAHGIDMPHGMSDAECVDTILQKLKPLISNRVLFAENYEYWEALFFATPDGLTKKAFDDLCEE